MVTGALGLVASLTIFAGRGAFERQLVGDLILRTEDVLEEVDRYLSERGQEVDAWAGLEIMDDTLIGDPALRIENLLLTMQREHPGYFATLTVLGRDQTVIASTDVALIGQSQGLQDLSLRDIPGGVLRVGPLPADGSAENRELVLVHPITSRLDPAPIGWLIARVNWDPVVRIVGGAEVGGQRQDAGRFLLLVDDAGNILAGDPDIIAQLPWAANLARRSSAAGLSTEDVGASESYLVARHPGTGPKSPLREGTRIIALWRTDQAYALVRLFVATVLGSAVVGLALAVAASTMIARHMGGRIRTLMTGTRALADGDLSYRVKDTHDDELGSLARSFNDMAARLTESKEHLEASLARWQALVGHAPDLILTVDRNGMILFSNRAFSGPAFEEGTSLYSHSGDRFRELVRQRIDFVFRLGEAASLELEGPGSPGSTSWYSCRFGPIMRDGDVAGITVIVTDITERKRLEKEILEVDELERERIGQDLHDGLGQVLTGISLLGRDLELKLARSAPEQSADARRISTLAGQAIEQARGLARGLYPITVEMAGLRRALEELATGVTSLLDVSCRVEGEIGGPQPDASTSMHLFRIAQEAVNNALRHGQAKNIVIAFANGADRTFLTVTDDGVGMPAALPEGQGLGLRLMRHRARSIGASLDICRGPKQGTVVTCGFRADWNTPGY